jgi:hypothetical protein
VLFFVTVMVAGMIRVFFVAVIFVFVVGGELFLSGFFGELHAMESVAVGDVRVMRSSHYIVLVVRISGEEVVLRCQFKVMGSFTMSVERFFEKFVIVCGYFVVVFGHNRFWWLGFSRTY